VATCPTCRNDFAAGAFCPRDGTRLAGGEEAPVLGGRYRLLRKIGEGGMGEVYEAEHVYIRRRVAVKVLRREMATDQQAVERLQREAQSTSGLGHPNIVDCFDFGYSDEGQVYLVMEWLDGENLDQRLQRGPIDIPTALDIATQAATGLAEAHEHGVIHRDLKPANLFLTRGRSGALVVKVLDFGIAKLAIHQTKLTGTGVLVGTPNYMAPEQAFGETVDARTDVYALGVILYELITGAVPFHADSPLAVLNQHTSRMPMLPSARAPDRGIEADVEATVMRCLEKRPDDRYGSMHDVIAALDALRGGTTSSAVKPAPPPSPDPEDEDEDEELLVAAGGGSGRFAVAIAVAVALVGVAAFLLLRGGGPSDPRTVDAGLARRVDAAARMALDASGGPSRDAGMLLTEADAAIVPDAALQPAWTHRGRGDGFAYLATVAAPGPIAGAPFELVVELTELSGELSAAAGRGELRARIALEYFKDHETIHVSTDRVDGRLRVSASVQAARSGKHHLTLDLLDGETRVDRVRFDLPVAGSP